MALQSSMIGLLLHRKYITQSWHSCIRTCRLVMITVLFFTPVMCAAPETVPQIRRLSVTDLIVRVARDPVGSAGMERSMTL